MKEKKVGINKKITMKELYEKYVGKTGTVILGGLTVDVIISNVKNSYGRDRFLVTPVAGGGEVWIEGVVLKD